MADLITTPNIPNADDFYAELLAAHDGLEDAASNALNARLLLTLSNHIGDRKILSEALEVARAAG